MTESVSADAAVARIESGQIAVGVIGLGYVGLPTAMQCARRAESVVGVDVDPARVAALAAGSSCIGDVSDEELDAALQAGRFTPTTDYAELARCDVVLICVPTPLRKTGDPDVSYILDAVGSLAPHMGRGKLVVLESTTYPGTTEELVQPRLEDGGLAAGRDFFLAFSPERINPGPSTAGFGLDNVPKVVGGVTESCTRVAAAFYGRVIENVVPVSSSGVAEMVKLLENTYRSVNIALVYELALACHRMGIDVWEVVDAAKTKPYGFQAFYPGPGLGGHCIPIDPFYLSWKARLYGFETRFIDLAGRVASAMPGHVVQRVADLLNDAGKPLNGSRIHVLGVAYKRDVADVRESPALPIIDELQRKGARVSYSDPHVPSLRLTDGAQMRAVPVREAALAEVDCAIVVTAHAAFPWEWIAQTAPLIFDTRNALHEFPADHIHRL